MMARDDRPCDAAASPVPTAVVVVNFGAHHLMEGNLAPLAGDRDNLRVVVVDNFFSNEERTAVRRLATRAGWDLVPLDSNRGFGVGANVGVRHATRNGAEVVVLLNPDATLERAALSELVEEVATEPTVVLAPRIDRPDGSAWFTGNLIFPDRGLPAGNIEPAAGGELWVTGACLVVHADMWERLGGFDEDYFMYWEDVDLSYRCSRLGGTLRVRDDVHAVHSVGATQRATGPGKSDLYYRYNCRNRLVFAAKNLSREQVRQVLRGSPRYAWSVLLRGGRRQFLHRPLGPVLSVLRGSLEGYAEVHRRLKAES